MSKASNSKKLSIGDVIIEDESAESTVIPISSIDFEFDNRQNNAERSPKMIDDNSSNEQSVHDEISTKSQHKKSSTNNSSNETKKDQKNGSKSSTVENNKSSTNDDATSSTKKDETQRNLENEEVKVDTSLFDLSDHNTDDDFFSWRPLKMSSTGQLKLEASEVISETSNGENIVTLLQSDSWVPNSGPILTERD